MTEYWLACWSWALPTRIRSSGLGPAMGKNVLGSSKCKDLQDGDRRHGRRPLPSERQVPAQRPAGARLSETTLGKDGAVKTAAMVGGGGMMGLTTVARCKKIIPRSSSTATASSKGHLTKKKAGVT